MSKRAEMVYVQQMVYVQNQINNNIKNTKLIRKGTVQHMSLPTQTAIMSLYVIASKGKKVSGMCDRS